MREIRRGQVTKPFKRIDAGLIGVILLSLPAIVPLLGPGYFVSHDGMLHIYRLIGLDQAISAGSLYSRWFPDFAFGYGHPILNFYGPLSYYVGELFLTFGAGPVAAMKWAYALALLAAGVSMYLFAHRAFGRRQLPALVAALAYVYAPYHMADLFVRGALAELLAMAWFPLILWSVTRLILDRRPGHIVITAGGLAGLIATHSLSLLIFGPVLAAYVGLLLAIRRQIRPVVLAVGAGILALGLSTLYWLPAFTESGYVGLAEESSAGYRNHLAPLNSFISTSFFYRYFPEQGTVAEYPASLLRLVLAAPGVFLVFYRRLKPVTRAIIGLMTLVAAGSLFMTLAVSLPVWTIFEPALSFLQYPWRFQAAAALGSSFLIGATAMLIGILLPERVWGQARRAVVVVAVIILAVASLGALPYQSLDIADSDLTMTRMWTEEREVGQIGTTWTGEYLPIWVEEQRWAIGRSWLDAGGPDLAEANAHRPPDRVYLRKIDHGRLELDISNLAPSSLILHQFYYPGMGATFRDQRSPATPYGTLGLTALDLPAGEYTLTVGLWPTPAQTIGLIISLVSLAGIAIFLWKTRRPKTLGITAGIALIFVGLLLVRSWTVPDAPLPVDVQAEFEGKAALVAYVGDEPPARPGDRVDLSLFWLARQGFEHDLVTFVHLTTTEGTHLITQSDQQPDGGFTPTTRWLAGEIIEDRHILTLPADLPPGKYPLYGGIYEPSPLRNLEIISSDLPTAHDRVLLGHLEVVAP